VGASNTLVDAGVSHSYIVAASENTFLPRTRVNIVGRSKGVEQRGGRMTDERPENGSEQGEPCP